MIETAGTSGITGHVALFEGDDKNMGGLVGSVVTLKDGRKGKCICLLKSGEYLLATGKGQQINGGFWGADLAHYTPVR